MITEEQLRSFPLLAKLESAELQALAPLLTRRKAPKGSFILYAEDPGPSLMFLFEGKVKITLSSDDGKEVVLALFESGDFFGEMALLTGEDRSANVVAMTDCELFVLSADDFQRHLVSNTGLVLEMARELAQRLRASTSKIGDLALYDVYRRVARTLKSLGTATELSGQTVYVIDERPTHQELASMIGTSREMVTRALKGLEEDGHMVLEGKKLVLKRLPV